MAIFEEASHPRQRGKFAAKPLTPSEAKKHATVPIKKVKGGIKSAGSSPQQGGDLYRSKQGKGKMNTGKKSA